MPNMTVNLAALIGSRICHDLISPIGAISNGLELLTMPGNSAGAEIGLIGESVDNASSRIRFFRIAFGAAGDQLIGPAEIDSILKDLYGSGRLQVDWNETEAVKRNDVRLCFLAILCAEAAMPYGGNIEVDQKKKSWAVSGTADRINVDPELWSLLSGSGDAGKLQPSHVQFALLPLIAADAGRTVYCQTDANTLAIEF